MDGDAVTPDRALDVTDATLRPIPDPNTVTLSAPVVATFVLTALDGDG